MTCSAAVEPDEGDLAAVLAERYRTDSDRGWTGEWVWAGDGPEAEEARRRLLDRIAGGQLRPGERLGAERDLAQALGVSRPAVRRALTALERAGVVLRVRGRGGGIFIRRQKVERDLSRVVGVSALLRQQGSIAGSQIMSTGLAAADDETAAAMDLPAGEYVINVVRIRLDDGTPISLERVQLPAQLFPGLLDLPLGGQLYELLQLHYGTAPGDAVERIEVISAAGDEASILDVDPGAALLSITRTTKDASGVVFELSHGLFRTDHIVITFCTPASTGATCGAGVHRQVVQLRQRAGR
jgi:GntR family transcriptional regulator